MLLGIVAIVALAASAALAADSPSPAPSSAASSTASAVDPAIAARAKDWMHRVQTNTLDRSQLDAEMKALVTDDVAKKSADEFGPLGDPTDFTYVNKKAAADSVAYVFAATFKSGSLYWIFAVNTAGKISGLRFLPRQ